MERNGISFFHVLNQDNRKLFQCLGAYRDIFMRQMTINMFCTGAGVASGRTCRPRHEREGPTQWEGLVLPGVTTAPARSNKTLVDDAT